MARNGRLEQRLLSPRGTLLEKRCKGLGIEFRQLMQTDLILWLRGYLDQGDVSNLDHRFNWWPDTLVYAEPHDKAFEVFARSRSARYFDRAKVVLGVENKDAIASLIEAFSEQRDLVPSWGYRAMDPAGLLGISEIAIKA